MEIKGLGRIISTYKTQKTVAPKSTSAAVSAKNNTDRVEFGFETALAAAKAQIVQEASADATVQELREAMNTAAQDIPADEIAALIFMG